MIKRAALILLLASVLVSPVFLFGGGGKGEVKEPEKVEKEVREAAVPAAGEAITHPWTENPTWFSTT